MTPVAPSFAVFIARPPYRGSVHGNLSFVLISSPNTLSPRSSGAAPDRQKQLWGRQLLPTETRWRAALAKGLGSTACHSCSRAGIGKIAPRVDHHERSFSA